MQKSSETVASVPFDAADIICSRTAKDSTIVTGDSRFQTISEYDWDALIGAPHSVIRHPDMPKGLFWMLWNRLAEGKATGFFVKNRTKTGGHYWAYAFVSPLEDGYLSVRIKPQQAQVRQIAEIYEEVLEAEADLTPEESGKLLKEKIAGLGFESYEAFMAASAGTQVSERAKDLGRRLPEIVPQMADLRRNWTEVEKLSEEVASMKKLIVGTPINLRIQAKQLDARGGALGVIATNYTALADEISERMSGFVEAAKEMAGLLEDGSFLACMSVVQKELVGRLESDTSVQFHGDPEAERALLSKQATAFDMQADRNLQRATEVFRKFRRYLTETERILSGLSVTRVMCKIENAYTPPDARTSIDGTVKLLQRFCDDTGDCLSKMRTSLEAAETIAAQAMKSLEAEPEGALQAAS